LFKIESLGKGLYVIHYLNKIMFFSIYKCTKRYSSLEWELQSILDICRNKITALIPVNAIITDLQIIQGVFNFYIYKESFAKIRNKGLLLSMFILGMDQLKTTIDFLTRKYNESSEYFLVILDKIKVNRGKCIPYSFKSNFERNELLILSKNISNILEKL